MSSEPVVARSPSITLGPVGMVEDGHRRVQVVLPPDTWRLLAAVGAGPVPVGRLWPEGADDESARHLIQLAEHGLVSVRFPPAAIVRAVARSVIEGSDGQLRMLAALGVRRIAVDAPGWPAVIASCVLAVTRAYLPLVFATGLVTAALTWLAVRSVALAAGAAFLPLIIVVSLGVHEAAHLIVLRRMTGHRTDGALLIGLFRLSVVRPDVTGRRLRAVAVAGPLAGVGVGVLATALIQAQPVCGLAGMIVVALHLANLTPRAPDGRACWTGQP